jgi:peroxidase
MHLSSLFLLPTVLPLLVQCNKWPYDRYHAQRNKAGHFVADTARPEFEDDPQNTFIHWLHHVSNTQDSAEVRKMFANDTIPKHVTQFDELFEYLTPPAPDQQMPDGNRSVLLPPMIPHLPSREAADLLSYLKYDLDHRCTVDRSRWWYRTYDGSCNWLKQDEISEGQIGTAKVRDYNQHTYSDGISKPRDGPNPRAVSNAFFRRNSTIYYEHTPLLLGLIEFIMHDITYSMDSSKEYINVSMPEDEDYFDSNTTFHVWRTEAVPGTGISKDKPRENVNMASTWLDISSLYGSTQEVARALRSFQGGKLLTQELKTRGQSTYASYLPFNSMNVPMHTKPGVDPKTLFAGGDPRTNEDWLMLGVHTLLLREHNRLCTILAKQHPEYDDEQLYQTIRLVMSAKYTLMANSYQMAYWTDKMPWPRDDGAQAAITFVTELTLRRLPALSADVWQGIP